MGLDEWNSWFKSQVRYSNRSQDIVNLNNLKKIKTIKNYGRNSPMSTHAHMKLNLLEEQIDRDRMSQVRMEREARVPRYWPKSCRGRMRPTDMVYNNSFYDPPNISPIAPKKWQVKILYNGVRVHT
ncbi:UNVERIFIED_CONTAM: hypothetical protein NCL1_60670 [Trichonephila clavipes]